MSDGHPNDESASQRLVKSKIERLLQPAQFRVGININRRHQKNFDRFVKACAPVSGGCPEY